MKILWAFAWIGIVAALSVEGALPLAQPVEAPSTARNARLDTLYVIPAGPVAGGFTIDSRVQVIDTIAGWAKIQLEGWTPVGSLSWNQKVPYTGSVAVSESGLSKQSSQCTAITKKGTRCKRIAKHGSTRCWQHPQ